MADNDSPPHPPEPMSPIEPQNQHNFPPATHNSPRTWFITSSLTPLIIRLIRLLLGHGDYVVACLPPQEAEHEQRSADFRELVNECMSGRKDREGWQDRIRSIRCNGRSRAQCGAALAEAKRTFGRIDILLCCASEAIIGTVEELSTSRTAQNLVREQFETIFFSQVNFIKASLPLLREQHTGHIVALTSVGGHIGTPSMSVHTAATWALEGFCDSLAYEIAPFNIKVTIVQPHKEIQTLTNKIVFAPPLPQYQNGPGSMMDGDGDGDDGPHAPSVREMLAHVLNSNPDTALDDDDDDEENNDEEEKEAVGDEGGSQSEGVAAKSAGTTAPKATPIVSRFPKLPPSALDGLVNETVHALAAIGGHENPPARHIVGFEGAEAVKEKLKTVTEELEDFVEASLAVDFFDSELKTEARRGNPPMTAEVEGGETRRDESG